MCIVEALESDRFERVPLTIYYKIRLYPDTSTEHHLYNQQHIPESPCTQSVLPVALNNPHLSDKRHELRDHKLLLRWFQPEEHIALKTSRIDSWSSPDKTLC
jgi:hypothetical protein